ncbi:MAG TPA: transketolase [Candidatus Nanoarchaeia archaeon]|nr:transketolase [Candidatus Nanoarchaeia archaeon]
MRERKLKLAANAIRKDLIKALAKKESGHTADSLSAVDILTALYFEVLKHNPRYPKWQNRDRVFTSNKHLLALHTTLAHSGYFAKKTLDKEIGIEAKEAGLSTAIGCALAAKMDNESHRTYCILSDEDHNQGHTWEAILFAAKHKLNNLTAIIDRNNTQPEGYTEEILPLEPLRAKYEAFNWHVIEIDGHNIKHIIEALNEAKTIQKPTAIIAQTIPGKGVSFIENKHEWHTKTPTEEQAQIALEELEHERSTIE